MKIGSLFDGSGTCPLAGKITGFKPVWASEVEPFPIKVTMTQFPKMTHLGDVSKINGAEIEPVDFITFGSPCQDLSVAGKRAGLDGERSGLFMEAVRIIKEMRGATNGKYPQIAMWENVPGAFSSNDGEDFRLVLEELCKVYDPTVFIPRPTNKRGKPIKWDSEGCIVADGFSIAWRLLDAKFWGVPQRRKRIFLVADFGGQCAGQILFERGGLSRDFTQSRKQRQGASSSIENGSDAANRERERVISLENHPADSRVDIISDGTVQTLTSRMGTGGNNVPMILSYAEPIQRERERESNRCRLSERSANRRTEYDDISEQNRPTLDSLCSNNERGVRVMAIDRAAFNQGKNAQYDISIDESGIAQTLVAKGPGAVAVFWDGEQCCSTLTASNAGGAAYARQRKL